MDTDKFNGQDRAGNRYHCKNLDIKIQIAGSKAWRHIGTIRIAKHLKTGADLTIFTKHEKEKDIFRKLNAWSVPYFIWTKVDGIHVITEKFEYKLLKEQIVDEDKTILHFQDSDTEVKVYLNRDSFHIQKRN